MCLWTRKFTLNSESNPDNPDWICLGNGRLSELFCVVLCTEAVHSHKHT